MNFEWTPELEALAKKFLALHFGDARGVTSVFPTMRNTYPWSKERPDVIDSRVPAKNNTEYHGFERHAWQYHATAQYEYSYHHWILAAGWRKEDAKVNDFNDTRHEKALTYCVRQAFYNRDLWGWQKKKKGHLPVPEDYGLDSVDIERGEAQANAELEAFSSKAGSAPAADD